MMSDLPGRNDEPSFVFCLMTNPARLIVGLLACVMLGLAGAAIPLAHLGPKPANAARAEAGWSGDFARLRAARRDAGWVAYAPSDPAGRRLVRVSSRAAVARGAFREADLKRKGRSRAFDVAEIANVLREGHQTRRAIHMRRPLAIVLTRLDADGVTSEPMPVPRDAPAAPRSGQAADVQTAFHRLQTGSLDFDSGLGRVTTAARAGTLNGSPAAALNIGLSEGPIRFDAAGMTEMAALADPATMRRAFKVSTGASIPLD